MAGDLADLRPEGVAVSDGAQVTKRQLLESSLDATADLLREVERLRAENATLRKGRPSLPQRAGRRKSGRVSTGGRP